MQRPQSQVFDMGCLLAPAFGDIRVFPRPAARPRTGNCFIAGTRLLSARGWIGVEGLLAGDVLVTRSDQRRVVRAVEPAALDIARPIRVLAGAFGPDLPGCDLILAPDHAIFVEDVLIPVRHLVNGATICREPAGAFDGYRLDLGPHDVVLADGLPVESVPGAHGDTGCAPLVVAGPVLRRVRSFLLARADTLGHTMTQEPDLHLRADGRRVWGQLDRGIWSGWIPAATRRLSIASRASAPAECMPDSDDHRSLGVALRRVSLRAGSERRRLEPDAAGWGTGFHPMEEDSWSRWRWTDGNAELSPALWQGLSGQVRLELHIFRTLTYRCTAAAPLWAAAPAMC